MNNFINIDAKDQDCQIFRILSFERFLELIEIKKNTLVRPKLWDDPFENFLLKSTITANEGQEKGKFEFHDDVYGQCWTDQKESDAMWRIYSPNKQGICIQTTIKKLYASLYQQIGKNDFSSIGKVKYQSEDEIERKFGEILLLNQDVICDSLLIKRNEFAHENEIRLLCIADSAKKAEDIYQYEIDPFELIEAVIFDPRMNDSLENHLKEHLTKIGIKKISRSSLYQLPHLEIRI